MAKEVNKKKLFVVLDTDSDAYYRVEAFTAKEAVEKVMTEFFRDNSSTGASFDVVEVKNTVHIDADKVNKWELNERG